LKYFYSSASMGFHGEGYFWHKPFQKVFRDFPDYPIVTKSITLNPKRGTPWNIARLPFLQSTWNKIGLHNNGFEWWCETYRSLKFSGMMKKKLIPSLYGTFDEVQQMVDGLYKRNFQFDLVEINLSCPNVKLHSEQRLPSSPFPFSLKLRHDATPFNYKLDNVKRITLNSVPSGTIFKGGISGKLAQKYNWKFIENYRDEMNHLNISIAGCSITSLKDILFLKKIGCTEIGLGSILLIDPWLVLKTKEN